MEDIKEKIKNLQCELEKKENKSKLKQRVLIRQLKDARQETLDLTKKQMEDIEEKNRNLERALELVKAKELFDIIKDVKKRAAINQAQND